MRFFNVRRLLVSLLLMPIFISVLIVNRLFMMLDYVFFPHFLRKEIKHPIFIISAPRTATTFLYHKICEDREKITAFKLWEIVFAPSICQKYILLLGIRLDQFLGGFAKKGILLFQELTIGKLRKKHLIGLELHEEDEAILLWNLSTVYLNFFYPDTPYFDAYFAFDDALSDPKKKRIMRYYKRCVQRHCFVFDKKGNKTFLSKNPIMMSKVKSVAQHFPDARVMCINRSLSSTLPSTLALNDRIYGLFTSIPTSEDIHLKTKQILIKWHKMAHQNMMTYFPDALQISFERLVKKEPNTLNDVCRYAGISIEVFNDDEHNLKTHKSTPDYQKLKQEELNEFLEELPFLTRLEQ
ncbi:MAG: hypothetical protein ACI8ZN_002170 [Bacteroidia bacterium]|jgi:hypothetical protein